MDAAGREALARYWRPTMLRYAWRLTDGDDADAEDLVQQAFLRLCQADGWEYATHSGMCGIIRQVQIDAWRKAGRHPWGRPLPLVDWTPGHVEGPERTVCDRETLAEIMALPGADLLLANATGWSRRELAARCGITVEGLKTRLYRLRHGPLARLSPWL